MKKLTHQLTILVFLLFISTSQLFAVDVTIQINDHLGNPLANYPSPASTELKWQYRCGGTWNYGPGAALQTDVNGQFIITGIVCGNWDNKITVVLNQTSLELTYSGGNMIYPTALVNVNLKNACSGLITSPSGTVDLSKGTFVSLGNTGASGTVSYYAFAGSTSETRMTFNYTNKEVIQVLNSGVNEIDHFTTNLTVAGATLLEYQTGGFPDLPNPVELLQGTHNLRIDGIIYPVTISGCTQTIGAYVWDGSAWTPSTPTNLGDRAIFNGNFDESLHGTFTAGFLTLNTGFTVALNSDRTAVTGIGIGQNATLELVDNAMLNATSPLNGLSGSKIKLTRNFTRAGWQHIGWPVKTTATVANLTATGFALNLTDPPSTSTNVYYWDAATAGWLVPTAATSLVGRALNIYVFAPGNKISLEVARADFNNATLAQSYTYFNPGPVPPGNATGWSNLTTDGWNHWVNPYQQNLNPDLMALPVNLDNAVYAWDGSTYQQRVAGVGALTGISVNQSYFVRTPVNNGSHSIPLAARTTTAATSFFKNGDVVELKLQGEGFDLSTFIYQNDLASNLFDSEYDAFYFSHSGNAPHFYSVGEDSTAYSINALPTLSSLEQYLTFFYGTNGKNFTISVDPSALTDLSALILHDLHTGTNTDLLLGNYSFISHTAAPAQRFKLIFVASGVGVAEWSATETVKVWANNGVLHFEEKPELENAMISVYNLSGQLIARGSANDALQLPDAGVYVVNIITADGQIVNVKVATF